MGKMKYNGQDYLSAGDAQVMQGATSVLDGMEGLVPQPLAGEEGKVLYGDGTWKTPTGGTEVIPNPSGTPTDTLSTIEIDGDIYEIQGSGRTVEEKITYYVTDAQISDGTNHQFVTVQLDEPLEEEQGYIMVLKNSSGGSIIKKVFFNYLNYGSYYSINIDCGSPIGTMSLQITSTTITCTNYTGSWQDIYIDVYKSNPTGGLSPVIYSTTEREIGVWTDNKPLYQKTFTGTVSQGSRTNFDLTSYNIDTFCGVEAGGTYALRDDSSYVTYPLNANEPDGSNYGWLVYFRRNTKELSVYAREFNISEFLVTITYTKTTDVSGSGSYNTLGVPTVHYTTTEQVIGTWIDGSTLYQICKSFTVNRNSTYTFNFTEGNAKMVNGYIINLLNNINFPLNATWDGLTENFLFDDTHFYIKTTNNIGDNSTLFLTIQYTKSSS